MDSLLILCSLMLLAGAGCMLAPGADKPAACLEGPGHGIVASDPAIAIDGNDELDNEADGGDGSPGTPYIIENRTIDANGTATPAISIQNTDKHFIIRNCTLLNATGHAGILMINASNGNITGNVIFGNLNGIHLAGGSNGNNITGNELRDNGNHGIHVYESINNRIANNNITGNDAHGVYCYFAPDNVIASNNVSGNDNNGIFANQSNQTIIDSNEVVGNQEFGITVWNSNDCALQQNNVSHSGFEGIFVWFSASSVVWNNDVSNSPAGRIGIWMSSCTDTNVTGNVIHENERGLRIDSSSRIKVTENQILQSDMDGVNFVQVTNLSVSRNTIAGSSWNGIVADSCINASIALNVIVDSGYENALCWGGTAVTWDDGALGNYWGDYVTSRPAAVHDGQVWNMPYTIAGSGGFQDRYPLAWNVIDGTPAIPVFSIDSPSPILDTTDVETSWAAVPGADEYRLYRSTVPITRATIGVAGTVLVGTTPTLAMNDTVDAGTHWYAVVSVNASGPSDPSRSLSINVQRLPSAPLNFQAVPGNRTVELSWNEPADTGHPLFTGYNLSWWSDQDPLVQSIELGLVTSYTHEGLTNGVTYTYMISASGEQGEGASAGPQQAKPVAVPSAPGNVQATPGHGEIVLAWNAPQDTGGSSIIAYHIFRDGVLINTTVDGNVHDYVDTGLADGTQYTYKIRAVNDEGAGLNATIAATTWGLPSKVTGLTATAGDGQVALSWTAPGDGGTSITAYKIFRDGVLIHTAGVTTTYTDTGLVNNQAYSYVVQAVNVVGDGPASDPAVSTPVAGTTGGDISGPEPFLLVLASLGAIHVIARKRARRA